MILELAREPRVDNRKQWVRLSPDMLETLQALAGREDCSLEALITSLLNEGLAHRLTRRT
jgi:hypothetical protein